ncbi:MAG: xanthine dehydrogenase family protein molybdopterin-binding subunit [Rhodospirillales bacterium]|nr:xanthine dehydrogenase family protein molybdopterin-binding subunit [Alphaproteobacteria bacterium]MBL6947652.1 xanthine dehydrogenase family protein molybdopterin-binding subunit [Rhodospirillales bacterium]
MNNKDSAGTNFKWVGKRTRRPDGPDKVTGRARYGDDMIVPGMLHAKILRSPHAHAKILSIDTSKARAFKGVKAVVTSADIPDHPLTKPPYGPIITDFHDISCNVLAREKVLYDGHAIAGVAATSERIARAAIKLIEVEYEVLPHVLDPLEASKPDAPVLHDHQYTHGVDPEPEKPSNVFRVVTGGRGDVEKGFAGADIIVEREFSSQPVHQGYIEPQACIATASEDDSVELWTTTQGHFVIRAFCARLLNMDMARIRVTASEIGGGFGGKNNIYAEPVAIRLSQMTGRPVRMVMSRSEVFRATGPASGTHTRIRMGAKKDGTITAAEVDIYNQAGAFKGSPVGRSIETFFSAYTIENIRASGYDVCVNRPKVAAYRAPGAPMAAFAAEGTINELASRLGMDAVDIRMKNAVREGDQSLSGIKYGQIGLLDVLEKVKSHEHYSAPLGPNQGRGFALGYWMHGGGLSSVSANLLDDGTIAVATGNPDIGGSRSSMRVMAAEELGIDIEMIKPIVADTGSMGYSHLTAGSRTTFATGMAVINAVREIIDKLRALAAKKWEIPVEEITWEAGQAETGRDGIKALSLKELAGMATKMGGPIAGHSEINAGGAGAAFSAQLVDVEVDPETGFVSPKRYTVFQDVGRAISPDYVEGQIQGGAVQGIGWALNEEYVYDDQARLQNTGFLDYRMPVASDVPMIDAVLIEVPNPNHPYGVRGVGEPPIISAPAAVANAVENAIGITMSSLPLSPPKVLNAIEQGQAEKD